MPPIFVFHLVRLGFHIDVLLKQAMTHIFHAVSDSTVSKNPRSQCNPNLNSNNAAGIAVGVIITLLTLAWTGWSWTAHARVGSNMCVALLLYILFERF